MTATRCTLAASGALAAWVVAFLVTTRAGLWINTSPSLPIGIYRTSHEAIGRGSIVVLCLPESIGRMAQERGYLGRGPCPGGVGRLGKIVAAVAGDTVDVEARGVVINGRLIEGSVPRAFDHEGRPLPRIAPGAWIVPPGAVFVLATRHPLSFDSRYYGAVSLRLIGGAVQGLFFDDLLRLRLFAMVL